MYQPHCGLENVLMSWGHDGELQPGDPFWGGGAQGLCPHLPPCAEQWGRGLPAPPSRPLSPQSTCTE